MPASAQEETGHWKRRLMIRDSLVFLGLVAVTVSLFVVTLFLFRSFSSHRLEVARRWYLRGQRDLDAGDARQAVIDLRNALGNAPEDKNTQLLLAEALSQAGDVNAALAYFTNLWEAQPGSGPLNLQLARLDAKLDRSSEAVRYYRAAIYGTWEGDGPLRRREVRLELVRYLISRKDFGTAQTELLIASGNAAEDARTRAQIAELMIQAGELPMALAEYKKALAREPHDEAALLGAGETAFRLGRYASAQTFLRAALRRSPNRKIDAAAASMLLDAEGALALYPAQDLPNGERTARTLRLRGLAEARWSACRDKLDAGSETDPALNNLASDWKAQDAVRRSALRDPAVQQDVLKLVFATEEEAARLCGAPDHEDAMILLLGRSQATVQE